MKNGKIVFFMACVILGSLFFRTAKAPMVLHHTPAGYALSLHEFHVGDTDVCFIFDREKTLLIDRSKNRDPRLIEAYLAAHAVSHLDFVLCTLPPASGEYPFPSVGAVFTMGMTEHEAQPLLAGAQLSLDGCTVSIVEAEGAPGAVITYKNTPFRYPLQVQAATDSTVETAMVMIIRPSADGVQTEISHKPLREILGGETL